MLTNQRILLVKRPRGRPKPSDFVLDHQTMTPPLSSSSSSIVPPSGGVLLRTMYISIDPAMRGWMSNVTTSYLPPVKINDVMRASSIGVVVLSDNETFPVGTKVKCDTGGVQTYVAVSAAEAAWLTILPPDRDSASSGRAVPLSAHLGVLGTTGLTAYFGLRRVGEPNDGDTVLISGAAGATGSVAAQVAKIMGCGKVIGTAGTEEKCRWLEENRIVDVAINYKRLGNKSLSRSIREAAGPKGVNVVFDNVGGSFLEAALSNLARGARVVLCGAISQYNQSNGTQATGPRNYMNLLVKRASMKGFVVFDYRKEYGTAIEDLTTWIREDRLAFSEHVVDGIENFHSALMTLFDGTNQGKVVLRVSKDEELHALCENQNGNNERIRSKL